MKKLASIVLFFLCSVCVFATSIELVNRNTAIRCLKLCENYYNSGDYENAINQAELGLSYDDSISDLLYILASSKYRTGSNRNEILPIITRSIMHGDWVDYNKDKARTLYAELLSDIGEYEQSLIVLDVNGFIYSSDAEYIRAMSYYRIGSDSSISKAREKINIARKIYPQDTRFPLLFFINEYRLRRLNGELNEDSLEDALVEKIADSFIAKLPEYENPDSALELYAISFATGIKRKKLLEAYAAHELKHPLYPILALEEEIMSEEDAIEYFFGFADSEITSDLLEDFVSIIKTDTCKSSVMERLLAYNGTINFDFNGNMENELSIKYKRGRPEIITYDENNDGNNDWIVRCDFGSPLSIDMVQDNITLQYGSFPYVTEVCFDPQEDTKSVTFRILDKVYSYAPLEIIENPIIRQCYDSDFYMVKVIPGYHKVDHKKVLSCASSYELYTSERENAYISFALLDGVPQSSEYYSNDKIYARTMFKSGRPDIRYVDNSGDGVFETTQHYGYDPDNDMKLPEMELNKIMEDLYGKSYYGDGIFVQSISVDTNGDTIPDFIEEYYADGGKISSWDYDADGLWDVKYTKYPVEHYDDPLIEESQFYKKPGNVIVTIKSKDGYPVEVSSGDELYSVTKGTNDNFYWIGDKGSEEEETYLFENIKDSKKQGVCEIIEDKENRILVVQINKLFYGQIIKEIPQ